MTVITKISSAELGALWMTYHKKTMILRLLAHLIEVAEDQEAKGLMSGLWDELHPQVIKMKAMFENEGAVTPDGFTDEDVNLEAPKLWDNGFDIMFSRILKEISMGMYVLHLTMSYRTDVIKIYRKLTEISENYYEKFTQYLLNKGLYTNPTYITMPKSTDYINDRNYAKGTDFFGEKRTPLNTVEFGYLYHSVESNIVGMQLLKGFSQVAKDKDVKKYFTKGAELSKEIISEISKILLENNIQSPSTPGGNLTNSTEAPYSQKMMMFCNYLLSGLSIGSGGFGAGFSLRNDLQVKNAIFGKDVFEYQREGIQLMMSKGWLEEPPKMDL